MFTGLSSKHDILKVLSLIILKNICTSCGLFSHTTLQSQTELCTLLLEKDGSFFFTNLITRLQTVAHEREGLRSLQATRLLNLVLKSLSVFAPNLLAKQLTGLLKLTYQSIDMAMIAKNSQQLLVCIDICIVLTEFVHRDQVLGARLVEKAEGLDKVKDISEDQRKIGATKVVKTS